MKKTITLVFYLLFGVQLAHAAIATRDPKQDLLKVIKEQVGPSVRVQIDKVFLSSKVPQDAKLVMNESASVLGPVSFHYEYQTPRGVATVPGNATVKGFAKVAVAATPIKNGEVFSEANVQFSERELSRLIQSGYYPSWDKLRSLTAVGYIRQDQIISSFFTQQARSIASGQWIDVVHERGALRVVARMKALEPGQKNQWIRAENPGSRKVVQVRVTGDGQATIR